MIEVLLFSVDDEAHKDFESALRGKLEECDQKVQKVYDLNDVRFEEGWTTYAEKINDVLRKVSLILIINSSASKNLTKVFDEKKFDWTAISKDKSDVQTELNNLLEYENGQPQDKCRLILISSDDGGNNIQDCLRKDIKHIKKARKDNTQEGKTEIDDEVFVEIQKLFEINVNFQKIGEGLKMQKKDEKKKKDEPGCVIV